MLCTAIPSRPPRGPLRRPAPIPEAPRGRRSRPHRVALVVACAGLALAAVAAAAPTPTPAPAAGRARVEKLLLAQPAYAALKKRDSAAFGAIAEAVARSPHAGGSDAVVLALARTQIAPGIPAWMAKATDRTAREFTANLLSALRVTAAEGKDACYALLATDEAGAVRIAAIPLGTAPDLDLAGLAQAIDTAATDPQPILDREDVARRLERVTRNVRHTYGDDVNLPSRLGEPGIDRLRTCEVTMAIYTAVFQVIGRSSEKEVGPVLRLLYEKQAARQPIG